ncbi:hypothetical protein GCM10022226_58040 [Sphaerisporangium flaviroseum]|uniref:Protein kinase domain-containing protein n=1 Tax=Sphaerisporangium flaviroseum TaxID=509199 RepID=A0ABP7IXP1_9ACTN
MNGEQPLREAALTDPRSVGPYVILRRLGEGGMGIVYLARDDAGRQVALKVIRPNLAHQEQFRRRFRQEAEAARKVARFCTAAVLDVGLEGEQAYIATEYIEGRDLSSVVGARGPLTGSNLEALAVSVATALAAIHRAGVVHRDLKPGNILLSPLGPRVIDFGIAQLADTGGDTGLVIGTPPYMSPEQVRGGRVTGASDVFAWGGVVTYAATGTPPFGTGAQAEVVYRVVNHVPRLDGLDERLRPLVERALDKDPARRPTAQQLIDRLLGQEEVTAEAATRLVSATWTAPEAGPASTATPPVLPSATATAGPAEPAAEPASAAPPRRPRARRRWAPLVAVGSALAVSAAVLLVWPSLLTGGSDAPPTGRQIYQDDFSDRTTDWSLWDYSTGGYSDGYLPEGALALDAPNPPFETHMLVSPFTEVPERVLIQVEASTRKGTSPRWSFGPTCMGEGNDSGDRYEFLLDHDGFTRIRRVIAGTGGELAVSKKAVVPKEALNGTRHRLQVSCEPGQRAGEVLLRMWVDGALANSVTDPNGLNKRGVGLIARVSGGGAVKVSFDDYTLYDLTPVKSPSVARGGAAGTGIHEGAGAAPTGTTGGTTTRDG